MATLEQVLPQLVDGGGYMTKVVMMAMGAASAGRGRVQTYGQDGAPASLFEAPILPRSILD
jgi:hypothetical protein